MDGLITLFYVLFSLTVVYPPTEFVAAGFTIAHVFDKFLGSENVNFVAYHMKRTTITALIHSSLPLGYIFCLWCSGERGSWLPPIAAGCAIIPLVMCYRLLGWWEYRKLKHPVVKALQPYVTHGSDWRVVAADLNIEYSVVDSLTIPLSTTSKLVATDTWLILVSQYSVDVVQQEDCILVAKATDRHTFSLSGEDEVQYLDIEVIPSRDDIKKFSFRISTSALHELQTKLPHPVRVPEHITLLPSLIERFVKVFREYVDQNPVYIVDQELDVCIGCMQATADVKLIRRCQSPPPHIQGTGPVQCQQCNCRVVWCCGCMARWWAARASGPPSAWLGGRCTCPVCRAPFCLLDVSPARPAAPGTRVQHC